jgi:hypothetical protein
MGSAHRRNPGLSLVPHRLRPQSSFELPPSGSLLLFLPRKPQKTPPQAKLRKSPCPPPPRPKSNDSAPTCSRSITSPSPPGTETLSNAYFYAASQFAFRKNGMDRNPWDSAVQFRDELISGLSPPTAASPPLTSLPSPTPPPDLEAVVERPDLYTITCNGRPVVPSPGRWWLDRAFGRISLDRVARPAQQLTLKAAPFRIEHELEPVYLIGSFTLRPADRGFTIAPDRSP